MLTIPSTGERAEKLDILPITDENAKRHSCSGKLFGNFLRAYRYINIGPKNPTPGYRPWENENLCSYKNCTQIFIVSFFIIAPK